MKRLAIYTAILATLVLTACGGLGSGPAFESNDGISNLIGQLKDNFGAKAAFNSILISYDKQIGNFVTAQGNSDISSNKLIEKSLINGSWQDKAEITMEIEDGEIEDFLYTLEDVDLLKVPELVKNAKEKVASEKGIEEVVVTAVSLTMPSRVSDKMKDLKYMINVEPKNGGTTFILTYDLSGNYLDMTY